MYKQKIFTIVAQVKEYAIAHRKITLIAILLISYLAYTGYASLGSTEGETRYVIGEAGVQTIISTVSGSGQVSTENTIELTSRVSDDVASIHVAAGMEVKAGALIASINARDAQKGVRDAQVNLTSAQLALKKLIQPADVLALTQSENTLLRAKESEENAEANLQQAYEEGFNDVSSAFLDIPTVMTGLQDILFTYNQSLDTNSQNIDAYTTASRRYNELKADQYRTDAYNKYIAARAQYDKSFEEYKSTSRLAGTSSVSSLVGNTYETIKSVSDAIKSANNLIQYYKDNLTQHNITPAAIATVHLSTLGSYTSQTNAHLASLLGVVDSIKTNNDTLRNAGRTIIEQTESLAVLRAGADPLDIASSQLTVNQRENALRDAQEKLSDYFIYAPFSGTIAKLNIKKTDRVTSGTAIATLITKQKIAEISLNEVDAAKIAVGQKVTLTFDAVDDLSIAGSVSLVDTVGTVSQGVVTYAVKISFDTQDERIKSGMSVSAAIITSAIQDVIAVPASAIKSRGEEFYVQTLDGITTTSDAGGIASAVTPREITVTIGVSNDTVTEIRSGITDGTFVITRIITNTTKTVAAAPSLFGGSSGTRISR